VGSGNIIQHVNTSQTACSLLPSSPLPPLLYRCSYGQAKLANLLMARELARRLKEEGSSVEAFSLHPGLPLCLSPRLHASPGNCRHLLGSFNAAMWPNV
jgi:NAD(P)-dependent dehydrogenase (short-subunit alcohol dehydrogenase family)